MAGWLGCGGGWGIAQRCPSPREQAGEPLRYAPATPLIHILAMFGRRPGGHGKILAAHAPERLELPKTHDAFLFGRGNECHAKLPKDGYVSRHHFLLEVNPPQATIRDLRSLNGTHVNGVRYGGRKNDSFTAGAENPGPRRP